MIYLGFTELPESENLKYLFMKTNPFKGKKILITAGPTREAIDPVRFISNHSSGKMGYALAEVFLKQGAQVILVSGPVFLNLSHRNLEIVKVHSATDMWLACCHYFEDTDIAVFAAAVADYRPARMATQKIKKETDSFVINMIKNVDIAYEFGKIKTRDQLSIGFALETNDELAHALDKLGRKNLDMVVLNSLNDELSGFGYDSNRIQIIRKDFTRKQFPLKSKKEVAVDIANEIREILRLNASEQEQLSNELYEFSYSY
jgi:phosphopantothenoylcysteine decarboxylase/phosphopantothenate--cysteine ligase